MNESSSLPGSPELTRSSNIQPPTSRFLLALVMFLLGACGLAYEYTLSKIAADLLGNSVQQWATMIATMLFAMGVGAEWQSKIRTENIAENLIGSQVLLAMVGGFAPMLMVYSFAMMGEYYVLMQYGLALVVGTMIGFEIPLIMRINEAKDPEMKMNLARILKMDYIGALVGALVWTFVFVRYLSLSHVSFVLGLVSLVSASLIFFLYHQQIRHPKRRVGEMLVVSVMLVAGMVWSRPLMLHAEQYLYRDTIVFTTTTPYQHIVLTENSKKKISCYINGHLQFKEEDEFIYHENLVHPAMMLHPGAKRVLVLGGGDGLAVREVLKYPSVKQITLVDIDPQMTELARHQPEFLRMNHGSLNDPRVRQKFAENVGGDGEVYPLLTPNQRQRKFRKDKQLVAQVTVVHLDASSYLRHAEGIYDVVILDFPDPSSPDLAKLYSKPFYMSLRHHLTPESVIVQQSGSPFHAKEAYLCIGRTLKSAGFEVLPYHDNVPSFGEWGWWLGRMLSVETKPSVEVSPMHFYNDLQNQILTMNEDNMIVEMKYLTLMLMKGSLDFGRGMLDSEYHDTTTLTENRVYHYYLQGWK